jgi:hypothetical protein
VAELSRNLAGEILLHEDGKMILRTLLLCFGLARICADWPMLHGSAQHTGSSGEAPPRDLKLQWVRHFENERLGTAMEPITGAGMVFVGTHQGSLYGLPASDGVAVWRLKSDSPFLHSPAYDAATKCVIAADGTGRILAIDAGTGNVRWERIVDESGFSASPVLDVSRVLLGSRSGQFYALELGGGKLRWKRDLSYPIRQTAALAGAHVFVTSEDLRVHCLNVVDGREVWVSEPLRGQTAGEYYPQVVSAGGKEFVVIRTNPVLSMGNQITQDRNFLLKNAGVEGSDWKKLDAYMKSTNALGTPELWRKEQAAMIEHEKAHPESRTFFVLDAETGREAFIPPILWTAGCQGVGTQPALLPDGRLLVMYRTAYGNWNLGVAPLVGLGFYDLTRNEITPLQHANGMTPPWNTFWGTADESQNFTVAGNRVFIVHQGTLSAIDLETRKLTTIAGERDTYGGFWSPSWARNEWHGPGRGAVALDGGRAFWLTGSRLLCLGSGEPRERAADLAARPTRQTQIQTLKQIPTKSELSSNLESAVREVLSKRWAPLYVEPGLAGREFFFDDSGDEVEALAMSFKHLSADLQADVKKNLSELWRDYPPFTKQCVFPLSLGSRREAFWIPPEALNRLGQDKMPHPFGNTWAIRLYAENCAEWPRVIDAYPEIKRTFEDWRAARWALDPNKGDLYANRYLSSLQGFAEIAERAKDRRSADEAARLFDQTAQALLAWWKKASDQGTLREFKGSGELDPFIVKGDSFSFRIAPHRHKLALIHELTPGVAGLIREKSPEAFNEFWKIFSELYATWSYVGEERQVHSGENFIDPPDLAMDGFKASAWLQRGESAQLLPKIDIPFCKADLFYIMKLTIALEAGTIAGQP